MWSLDDRPAASGRGWLESARRASLGRLVASHPAPAGAAAAVPAAGSAGAPPGQETGGADAAAATAGTAPPAVSWDQRGGIDDDEHLAAYNAFLARLNEAESGRKK
jgi:hypothetical protein